MNKIIETIRLDAGHLAVGESTRDIECPYCPEDDKERGSFVVTRNEQGLLYMCYRAKCPAKGFISSSTSELYEKKVKKFEPKYFTRPLTQLNAGIRRWLMQKYNLTSQDISNNHFRWDKSVGFLHMPITDWCGREVGACIKKLPRRFLKEDADMDYYDTQQKAIHYWFNECPHLYFPSISQQLSESEYMDWIDNRSTLSGAPIILVEDIISAIRVNQFANCVALLGHHLNESMVKEIRNLTSNVILALDADTWTMNSKAKPLEYKKKFEFYFDKFAVAKITKDPKEMTDDEIEEQILCLV